MKDKHKELLQHTLGADSRYLKKQWGFRNRFCSSVECTDHNELLELEKMGFMTSGERFGQIMFWATKEGAKAIGFKAYQLRNAGFK